jgi:ribosomal protein S12 methylthiotransferase accessory factor
MDMIVTFPGGLKVDAEYKGFTVKTDQPVKEGGENSAPSPFDLFIHSIGTCAGFYVMMFCQQRNIPTDDVRLNLDTERDSETRMIGRININIELPAGFPEKYVEAVKASADKCTVKKHILKPPKFNITAQIDHREET